LIYYPIISRTN